MSNWIVHKTPGFDLYNIIDADTCEIIAYSLTETDARRIVGHRQELEEALSNLDCVRMELADLIHGRINQDK